MDATLKRVAPLSGVLFVVLYAASTVIAMKGSPSFAADSGDILAFYDGNSHRIMVGAFLDILATPLWFLWDDGAVQFSLVDGRQKLRNLRRDPRISVVVVNPAAPTWYVELRGHVDGLQADPDLDLERRVSIKYTGAYTDAEPAGTQRFRARVVVERVTSQLGH